MAAVVGIDPSLTQTALAVAGYINRTAVVRPGKRLAGVERLMALSKAVVDWVRLYRPQLVVMEGYSMASKAGRLADLGELGGVLKLALWQEGYVEGDRLLIIPPPQLKKFVAGHGRAQKAAMVAAVVKRWKIDVSTDDEADAYGLARIGLALLEDQYETMAQEDVIRKIRAKFPALCG